MGRCPRAAAGHAGGPILLRVYPEELPEVAKPVVMTLGSIQPPSEGAVAPAKVWLR